MYICAVNNIICLEKNVCIYVRKYPHQYLLGNCCMDAAPNSETRVKGFLFGGADFGWCLCAITYGRSRSYVLYLWSSWKGGLVQLVPVGRTPGLGPEHGGHHLLC